MKTMLKKFKFIIIFLAAVFTLMYCSTPVKILPPGNLNTLDKVDKPNEWRNDIAPVKRPDSSDICRSCLKKGTPSVSEKFDGIQSSAHYFKNLILKDERFQNGDDTTIVKYLTDEVESISFLSDTSGFISFSHPLGQKSAERIGLPLNGVAGGTDIYYFFPNSKGEYEFNLCKEINTEFWDSHPYIAVDSSCKKLLLWSSDRADNKGGFSKPYDNSDLYYSFFDENKGIWGDIHNFAEVTDSINTEKHNEVSPHLFCLCRNPVLLFSSNRNSADCLDYDLYHIGLKIDFEKEKIIPNGTVEMFPKGNCFNKEDTVINTQACEMFPFVPMPYKDEETKIYFSSNRNNYIKPNCECSELNKDTIFFQNIGGYDIYQFPFDMECKAPKIKYHVVIKSIPGFEPLYGPYIIEMNKNGEIVQSSNDSIAEFEVLPEDLIDVKGGSLFSNSVNVETTADSVLINYVTREITELEPELRREVIETPYDTTIIDRYDTKWEKKTIPISDLQKEIEAVQNDENASIYSVDKEGDTYKLKIVYNTPVLKTIIKKRYDTTEKIIPIFDTVYYPIKAKPASSELTKKNYMVSYREKEIWDTIYVIPFYFKCPPCKWKYVHQKIDYRRNVPYYQTCFWEVNTSENLENHLREFSTSKYSGASFIELHNTNQCFGVYSWGLPDEFKPYRKIKRNKRIEQYRKFARNVDINLDNMTHEVADIILPAFDTLVNNSPSEKLIIQIFGYSDAREIERGWYIGDSEVDYYASSFDEESMNFLPSSFPIHNIIAPGASLISKDNDTLSRLRAYFGYMELKKRLLKDSLFGKYVENNEVLFPDDKDLLSKNINSSEFIKMLKDYKVIILVQGRKIDQSVSPSDCPDDGLCGCEALDSIRRIDVLVNRVVYLNGELKKPNCCSFTPPPPQELLPEPEKESGIIAPEKLMHESLKNIETKEVMFEEEQNKEAIRPSDETMFESVEKETAYTISLGAYKDKANAARIYDILQDAGIPDLRIEQIYDDSQNIFYRVRAGRFTEPQLDIARTEAKKYSKLLKKHNIEADVKVVKE